VFYAVPANGANRFFGAETVTAVTQIFLVGLVRYFAARFVSHSFSGSSPNSSQSVSSSSGSRIVGEAYLQLYKCSYQYGDVVNDVDECRKEYRECERFRELDTFSADKPVRPKKHCGQHDQPQDLFQALELEQPTLYRIDLEKLDGSCRVLDAGAHGRKVVQVKSGDAMDDDEKGECRNHEPVRKNQARHPFSSSELVDCKARFSRVLARLRDRTASQACGLVGFAVVPAITQVILDHFISLHSLILSATYCATCGTLVAFAP
jgi:hypothetical protein